MLLTPPPQHKPVSAPFTIINIGDNSVIVEVVFSLSVLSFHDWFILETVLLVVVELPPALKSKLISYIYDPNAH